MTVFNAEVVTGVTGHMNGDHPEDNLLIARAFGAPEATASRMVGLSERGGIWRVEEAGGSRDLEVAWPAGPISERPEIRREVVALYREACARLGVPPREEHGGSGSDEPAAEQKPFSVRLREGSWSDHSDSETSTFMEDVLEQRGTLDDYVALVAQHYFLYAELEAVAAKMAHNPGFESLHPSALSRLDAIAEDLEFLIGAEWKSEIAPVPATTAYVARVREIGEEGWYPGFVAHHYTRYLGDLSGGQMIARRVAEQHGFGREGVAFYDFRELGSPSKFKQGYREQLDRLGESLDADEQQRMLDEVRTAYHFNTAVFVDLERRESGALASAAS